MHDENASYLIEILLEPNLDIILDLISSSLYIYNMGAIEDTSQTSKFIYYNHKKRGQFIVLVKIKV